MRRGPVAGGDSYIYLKGTYAPVRQSPRLVNSYGRGVVSMGVSLPGYDDPDIPKEIAVDATDSPHLPHLGPHANKLDPHVGALLDHDVGVVGELRRGGAGVVFDFVGNQLAGPLAILHTADSRPQSWSYMVRDEQAQGPGLRKEAMGIHRVGDGVDLVVSAGLRGGPLTACRVARRSYHFALERPPDNGAVADCKLG